MEQSEYDIEEVTYHHIVCEGSSYEVGQQMAEYVKRDEGRRQFFTSATPNLKKLGFGDFESLQAYYEEFCPGITDELQGLADGLGVPPEKIPLWSNSVSGSEFHCSQVLVLTSISAEKHSYLGRSYEWNHKEEDLILCTARVDGKASHIGFTSLLSGRQEGMNEHGLVVSMTGGGIPMSVPKHHKGVSFWIAIRSLLDSCRLVEEALDRLESIPIADYLSLILVDKNDRAAHVEFADGEVDFHRIGADSAEQFLFSTNHFKLPKTEHANSLNVILRNSRIRTSLIQSMLDRCVPGVRKEDILCLLSTHHPDGLCNHYYNEYFGTTWSMIFDITDGSLDVCFGAPTHNEFRNFGLSDNLGIFEYPAVLPITKRPLPL